jgi:hypothetical protein
MRPQTSDRRRGPLFLAVVKPAQIVREQSEYQIGAVAELELTYALGFGGEFLDAPVHLGRRCKGASLSGAPTRGGTSEPGCQFSGALRGPRME